MNQAINQPIINTMQCKVCGAATWGPWPDSENFKFIRHHILNCKSSPTAALVLHIDGHIFAAQAELIPFKIIT